MVTLIVIVVITMGMIMIRMVMMIIVVIHFFKFDIGKQSIEWQTQRTSDKLLYMDLVLGNSIPWQICNHGFQGVQ